MKTNVLLSIIFVFIYTSCVSQKERIENIIMDCSYQSFADNGEAFKNLISDYENLLISEKILANNSGNSYLQFLKKFADLEEFEKIHLNSFQKSSIKLKNLI